MKYYYIVLYNITYKKMSTHCYTKLSQHEDKEQNIDLNTKYMIIKKPIIEKK